MNHVCASWKRAVLSVVPPCIIVLIMGLLLSSTGCGMGKSTTVQINDKITSLPAGQTYQFTATIQHDQKSGVTLSLAGAGTLILDGSSAIYLAPPAPPSPNTVTVTVTAANGSGASDSDTFTITAANGPVVSLSPTETSVSASAGTTVTLNIAVTGDVAGDGLTAVVGNPSVCGNDCGSFGAVSGTSGSGVYSVEFSPPSSVSASQMEIINVSSSLSNSTPGTAFVTVTP